MKRERKGLMLLGLYCLLLFFLVISKNLNYFIKINSELSSNTFEKMSTIDIYSDLVETLEESDSIYSTVARYAKDLKLERTMTNNEYREEHRFTTAVKFINSLICREDVIPNEQQISRSLK